MESDPVIRLDVKGSIHHKQRSTLRDLVDTYISSIFSGNFAEGTGTRDTLSFIDRDGTLFGLVLYFLRTLPLPSKVQTDQDELKDLKR